VASLAAWKSLSNSALGRDQARRPEEKGVVKRSNRALREAQECKELSDLFQTRVIARIIQWYNAE
jgi:hypothetical protein